MNEETEVDDDLEIPIDWSIGAEVDEIPPGPINDVRSAKTNTVEDVSDVDDDEDDQDDDEADVDGTDYETARLLGWADRDQWKGHGEWVDAATFLKERGSNPRLLQRALTRVRNEAAERDAEYNKRLQQVAQTSAKLIQQQKKKAMDEIAKLERRAVRAGDEVAYDHAQQRRDEVERDFLELQPDPEKPVEPQIPDDTPAQTRAWLQVNDWYLKDPKLAAVASDITVRNQHLPIGEQLALVDRQMEGLVGHLRKASPHPRPAGAPSAAPATTIAAHTAPPAAPLAPPRRRTAAVDPGGDGAPAPRRSGKNWSDLPPEIRAIANELIRANPKEMSRESFVKTHFEQY